MTQLCNELWEASNIDSGNPESVRRICAVLADIIDTAHAVATLTLPVWLAARIGDWRMTRRRAQTVNEV